MQSEKDVGSTFVIYIPASTKKAENAPALLPQEIIKGTETVLLVDDEPHILAVGKKMLEALDIP